MEAINKEGYWFNKDLFESKATFEDYRARYNLAQGWNKHMIGRRMSDYRYFAKAQRNRDHYIPLVTETKVHCVCGLIAPRDEAFEKTEIPERSNGHWDHITSRLAQVYLWQDRLVCAGCDLDDEIEFDEERNPIVDWDAAHAAHANCGLTR